MLPKTIALLGVGLAVPASSLALGIRLFDHDAFATARGDAFVATADNPSAIYYNPAGITQLPGHQVRGSVNFLSLHSTYDNPTYGHVESEDQLLVLPGFFYTYTPEKLPLSFGLGYYMPFGMALEWPKDAPFRTTSLYSELQDHTFSGIVAWKVNDKLSIAAGPAVSYAFTDLRQGVIPTEYDDEFRFKGDDIGVGVTAGLLWQPTPRHSFGLSYRSPVKFDFEGDSELRPYGSGEEEARLEMKMPQVIIVGYSFRPTPEWNLEVNLDWTDWEIVNTLVLEQDTPVPPVALNWENSFGVEAGVTRYFKNGLRVSAGYVFLENSVPEKNFNTILPDQNLHVFSAGLGGSFKGISWDVVYQYTFGPGREVNDSITSPSVNGHYDFNANAVAVSLGYKF